MATNTQFDVMSAAFQENRHAYLQRFRKTSPIHGQTTTVEMSGQTYMDYQVLGYEDVSSMLKDNRFAHEIRRIMGESQMPPVPEKLRALMESQGNWMLLRDAPDHTRLRSLVTLAFTPKMVAQLEPRVHSIAEELVTDARTHADFDVVRDIAFPLPVIVIAELLGVPSADRDLFKVWSSALIKTLDMCTPEELAYGSQVVTELRDYFRTVVKERRNSPREDLISGLISARDNGQKLTEEELLDMCILLLAAGHETTVNLIANAVLLMAQHEDQQALLRQQPELLGDAIEEVLRFESPIQLTGRFVAEDLTWGDYALKKGDHVALWLASANRDEQQFAHADRFDITRRPNRHMAFGTGSHFCLGAPLARQEGQLALQAVLKQIPQLTLLDETPNWRQSLLVRGPVTLPIRINGPEWRQMT